MADPLAGALLLFVCCVRVLLDGLPQVERIHSFKWDLGPTAVKWLQACSVNHVSEVQIHKCRCESSKILLLKLLLPWVGNNF